MVGSHSQHRMRNPRKMILVNDVESVVDVDRVNAGVEALLLSDAMTGDSDGTPSMYYVDSDDVECLVRTVLAAVDAYTGARVEYAATDSVSVALGQWPEAAIVRDVRDVAERDFVGDGDDVLLRRLVTAWYPSPTRAAVTESDGDKTHEQTLGS